MTGNDLPAVAQVIASRGDGGAEAFFVRLAVALAEAGLPQHLIVRQGGAVEKKLREAGIEPVALPFRGLADIASRWRLWRYLRHHRPAVVLGWMGRATRMIPSGSWVRAARLGGYYDLRHYRHCDYLIGNTPDLYHRFANHGWEERRIAFLPNFIDAEAAVPADRAALGTAQETPVLLAVGRLHPVKGFDRLIAALPAVPGAVLWLAGEGPEEAALRHQAAALGVAERVRFLGWRQDIAALMAAADLHVVTSRRETLGNTILEAWVQNCAVLACPSPGPEWLIGESGGGVLCAGEAAALATAINALLADAARRRALAGAGRDYAIRRFGRAAVVRDYTEAFRRMARRDPLPFHP